MVYSSSPGLTYIPARATFLMTVPVSGAWIGSVRLISPVRSRSWMWSSVMSQSLRRRCVTSSSDFARSALWKGALTERALALERQQISVWVATSSGL